MPTPLEEKIAELDTIIGLASALIADAKALLRAETAEPAPALRHNGNITPPPSRPAPPPAPGVLHDIRSVLFAAPMGDRLPTPAHWLKWGGQLIETDEVVDQVATYLREMGKPLPEWDTVGAHAWSLCVGSDPHGLAPSLHVSLLIREDGYWQTTWSSKDKATRRHTSLGKLSNSYLPSLITATGHRLIHVGWYAGPAEQPEA